MKRNLQDIGIQWIAEMLHPVVGTVFVYHTSPCPAANVSSGSNISFPWIDCNETASFICLRGMLRHCPKSIFTLLIIAVEYFPYSLSFNINHYHFKTNNTFSNVIRIAFLIHAQKLTMS